MAGAGRVTDHPHLADGQEGGDPFSLSLQVRHLAASRHPDPELLPGPGQPTADDAGHSVVGGGQLGMATGQGPPPPQVGPEQGMSERLPGPGDHRHQEGGGHDQPLRTLPAQPVAQPHIGRRHQGDQGQLQPVGPGGAEDAVEQPVGRGLPHHRGGDDRGGLVQSAPADRLAPDRLPIVAAPAVHDAAASTVAGAG
jgi:hypothetical protein